MNMNGTTEEILTILTPQLAPATGAGIPASSDPSAGYDDHNFYHHNLHDNNSSDLYDPFVAENADMAHKPHLMYWYYINGLAGTSIAIFGLVGNTVSIAILTQRTMRNSTSVLLIFMGMFDNVFLLLNLMIQTFPFIFAVHNICPEYIYVRQFLFKSFYAVVHMAHTGTIYMTMLVTVERAMVVMRPLRAKYICTRRRAVLVSLAVLVWAVIYNIPRCLEYGTQVIHIEVDPASNKTTTEIIVGKTEFAHSHFFNVQYLVYFNSVFHFILPFLVICVLNAMIVGRLVQRRRNVPRNQRSNVQAENESKLTIMVLSLTMVFCVCQIFAAIELIIVQLEKDYKAELGHCSEGCEAFSAFAETMTIVNSATNFLLYSIFGEKFRRACLRYMCPFLKQPHQNGFQQRTSQSLLTSSYRGETLQLHQTSSLESESGRIQKQHPCFKTVQHLQATCWSSNRRC